MTLLMTTNKKLASLIAGEESELCSLISKVVISIVIALKNDYIYDQCRFYKAFYGRNLYTVTLS